MANRQMGRDRWLRYLHMVFIGLFGFIMPFICWGAEATPGHPHSRAHIVFLPPVLSAEARAVVHTAAAALAGGAHELCTLPQPATAPAPVAKSTPLVLAVTLLLLVVLAVQGPLLRRDKADFAQRAATLLVISPPLAITTPPPRKLFFVFCCAIAPAHFCEIFQAVVRCL
jgi:hypothetical protein